MTPEKLAKRGIKVKPLVYDQISDRTKEAVAAGRIYRILSRPDGTARLSNGSLGEGAEFPSPEAAELFAAENYIARVCAMLEMLVGEGLIKAGKKQTGRLLDGREWNDMPEALTHG